MFVIENSIRQILRTPGKTILYLLLLALCVAFLAVGAAIWTVSSRNIETLESGFMTIGTAEQLPSGVEEVTYWDEYSQRYYHFTSPVYGKAIPVSELMFDGAQYIHPPEKHHYYGAYHEDFILYSQESNYPPYNYIIVEAEPPEDCVLSDEPVILRVKRLLYGWLPEYMDEIMLIDYYFDGDTVPMYAGKTYVISAYVYRTYDYRETTHLTYYVDDIYSSQQNKNGEYIYDDVGALSFDEVTEGYYDTPRGQRWLEQCIGFEKKLKTIPVVPTNATRLLMDFYHGNADITDGRDISAQEYERGDRVCLVQSNFAKLNELRVGDYIPLQLYYADYQYPSGWGFIREAMSPMVPGGLLNAQGKSYPVFEDELYEIVGIYSTITASFYSNSGFESGWNMVVIPKKSVKNSDEDNILAYSDLMKAYNTSFEIPNGTIDEFMEQWNKLGIDNIELQFYDKGYTELKDGFERMRTVSLILIVAGASVVLLVLTFFTFIFIVKNKKKTAIERSLGIGRGQCTLSLVSGMGLMSVLGTALGAAVAYLLGGAVMRLAEMVGEAQSFDTRFSSWVNNADKVAEVQSSPQAAGFGLFAAIALIVLAISICFALFGAWRNLKSEPLTLLSRRLDE